MTFYDHPYQPDRIYSEKTKEPCLNQFLFLQDDYRVCLANEIFEKDGDPICPVDSSGKFTAEVTHFNGIYVKVISIFI